MDELAKRFADLADKYGPHIADAAMAAARMEAISTLVAGMLCLSGALVGFLIGRRMWRIAQQNVDSDGWYIGMAVVAISAAIMLFAGLWSLINPWTWTALSHPELWIAKKAFKL